MLMLLTGLTSAWAQDLEERRSPLDEGQDEKLETSGSFESYWYEYDNLDFRLLDESSDQAILDSDDRSAFAFSGGSLDLGYRIEDPTRVVVSVAHRGLWGEDSIGKVNAYDSWLYFSSLYLEYEAADTWGLEIGRQFYSIGGLGGADDYVLADVIDMVRVDIGVGDIGHLTLIPVNVVGGAGENDKANFFHFIGQSSDTTFGFRGDHMTRRHGVVFNLDGIENLDAAAYGFYTDVAALGSGSDISYEGRLGNFTDNDWVANAGIRGAYDAGVVMPFASVDMSTGIDRKELVAADVDTNGLAFMAGLQVATGDEDSGLRAEAAFFQADGAEHNAEGLMTSHGYVGMKGRQVGGMMANRFMGFHPSAYLGGYGVDDTPHEVDRKAGTRVASAEVGYQGIGPVDVAVGFWFFQDTSTTNLDFADLDTIDPPYGYDRETFAAERRFGKVLGQEIDVFGRYALTEKLAIDVQGGMFLPGEFYSIQVDRTASTDSDDTQLGGSEVAWAASAGTEVKF